MAAGQRRMLAIGCASDMCVDFILHGNVRPRFKQIEQLIGGYTLEVGGSANIFASQFVKLGGSCAVVGAVGGDALGDFLLGALGRTGVDITRVRRDPGLKTGVGAALVDGEDRAILTYTGSIDATRPADLTDALARSVRHWHIASYFLMPRLRPHWPAWIRRLRTYGATVSLDTNWDPEGRWEGVRELLPLVDVFLPNAEEARAITGTADVRKAGAQLAAFGPLIAMKAGGDGALAFQGGRSWSCAVPAAARRSLAIVDTIGAGDSFDGGFLRGWLLGRPVAACLKLGIRCG
ncbi:MAG: carbohydrate kinase family protein, partial [Planctomycetes bacterium]|nr:carbohydrate kinase family protein [Planctomycetota bacterium]